MKEIRLSRNELENESNLYRSVHNDSGKIGKATLKELGIL